jgi:hypothetical protein
VSASEKVVCLMVEMLPEFVNSQHIWVETLGRTQPPERICAFVNNHMRFADLLIARLRATEESLGEPNEKISDAFTTTMKAFRNEAELGMTILTNVVCADFKEGLHQGLFRDEWENSRQVVDTLHTTLHDYIQDLKAWLLVEAHVKKILLGILRCVANTYLELLLTTGVLVTVRVRERLKEDMDVSECYMRVETLTNMILLL